MILDGLDIGFEIRNIGLVRSDVTLHGLHCGGFGGSGVIGIGKSRILALKVVTSAVRVATSVLAAPGPSHPESKHVSICL
jgi:hypothetical protein